MTGTNHGITGAVLALLVKEPALAVTLSFFSHFACDAIPHFGLAPKDRLFDHKFNIILSLDFLIAVSLMVVLGLLFPKHRWLIWTCMIAAASPDLMWAYYRLYIERIKKQKVHLGTFAQFHQGIQWSETPKGWFVEIGWLLVMGAIIVGQR